MEAASLARAATLLGICPALAGSGCREKQKMWNKEERERGGN